MASLYKRTRSPFWWVAYFDPSGRRKCESTGFRFDSVKETRSARHDPATKEMEEMKAPASERSRHELGRWVQLWIDSSYAMQPHTLESYTLTWKKLLAFFEANRVFTAEQIRREHCFKYLDWRQQGGACRNTAIHDLVVLRVILNEAVKREWITGNPVSKLGLRKDPRR
jgi:hypothetical protein